MRLMLGKWPRTEFNIIFLIDPFRDNIRGENNTVVIISVKTMTCFNILGNQTSTVLARGYTMKQGRKIVASQRG
jgi:hypothetical protein